jgi:hypothetical protein
MTRFWGHTLTAASLTLAAASALPACAHDDATLFVHGVLAPPTPSGGTCVYNDEPTAEVINAGIVDAALTSSYTPQFLVGNTMIPQGNSSTPTSETSRIEITSAVIQVIDPKTNQTIEDATVLTSAEVEPASGVDPSYAGVNASIMDGAAIAHFAPTTPQSSSNIALVNVTFQGVTLGGQSVTSNVYQFPVNVCFGCLVSVPPTALTAGYCKGDAPSLSSASACVIGQDQVTDCQNCNALAYCKSLGPQ